MSTIYYRKNNKNIHYKLTVNPVDNSIEVQGILTRTEEKSVELKYIQERLESPAAKDYFYELTFHSTEAEFNTALRRYINLYESSICTMLDTQLIKELF